MNETGKRAILVCAVSTPEQAKDDRESMPAQEKELTAIGERERWDVVDIIRIPGFSRSYFTLHDLAEAASLQNEFGPRRLEEHLTARDFDVMAVRSTNRFGREQSLNAEIIGRVIRQCRAEIFSVMDGWITRQNQRAMTAITGFRDSSEVDELVKRRAIGIQGRLKRGLPISGTGPFAYRVVRDPETGKSIRAEVREELQPLLNDLATVLLDQVPFDDIERVLFERYHHVAANGKPYTIHMMYKTLFSPFAWGHNFYVIKGVGKRQIVGEWAFDPSVPPPEGYVIVRDTHPPLYTGELADKVKAELRRRMMVSNQPSLVLGIKRFAGLVVCDACHWRHSYAYVTNRYGKTYFYMVCNNGASERFGFERCSNRKRIREDAIQRYLNDHIRDAIAKGYVSFDRAQPTGGTQQNAARLRTAATKLQRRLDSLIEELAGADDDLKPDYRRKIRETKDELQRATEQLDILETRERKAESTSQRRAATLSEIAHMGLDAFWQQDATTVNRMLRDYMAGYCLVVYERDILGFSPKSEINQGRRRQL